MAITQVRACVRLLACLPMAAWFVLCLVVILWSVRMYCRMLRSTGVVREQRLMAFTQVRPCVRMLARLWSAVGYLLCLFVLLVRAHAL
jgi:hypothetical protein